ncbi:MAG: hypothetical protein IJ988_03770, partial [Firmicutes bacterium]|nr:hypothetical protein [Bacillota bacterium]
PNGMTASITINGDKATSEEVKATDKKTKEKKVKTLVVKEVNIGGLISDEISQEELNRQQMAEDAQALGAAEESSDRAKVIAGALGVQACAFGVVLRIRKYFMEV